VTNGIVDQVEQVTNQLPFGQEINGLVNSLIPGKGNKNKKQPGAAKPAANDVEGGGRMLRGHAEAW